MPRKNGFEPHGGCPTLELEKQTVAELTDAAHGLAKIKDFVDTLEPTQAAIQGMVDTVEPTQVEIRNDVANIEGRTIALRDQVGQATLPMTDNQAVDVDNPTTLFELPQYIYYHNSPEPFNFPGGCIELYGGSWDKQEEVVVSAESLVDGDWEEVYRHVLGKKTFIPLRGVLNLEGFYCAGGGVRVGILQTKEGGGFQTWSHAFVR